MKTTFKYFIFAQYSAGSDNNLRIFLSDWKFEDPEYVLLGEHEVEHPIDMTGVNALVAAGLVTKQAAMRATASAAITEIDNQIASLLALDAPVEAVNDE